MNELKVGLLTLMAIASVFVVSLKITANKSGFGDYIEYRTILNDASGIFENSSIKVAGIVAGRIKTISLSGSQALVIFEVLESIKITQFSVLRIKSVGFLGDKYLDIYLGNPDAPRLKPGTMILAEGGSGFEQIGKDASEILKDVKEIARSIKESLKDEEGNNVVKLLMADIKEFSRSAKETSQALERIIEGNESKLNNTLTDIEKLASQLAYETDRYEDGSFMNDMEAIKPILAKVESAVGDLQQVMADVKSGKGTVGRLLRDDEVIDKVNETLSGVNRLMGRVNNFKTDIGIFTGVNSNGGARTQFDLDLITAPERFFRLGLVSSDFGPQITNNTTTTTTIDDNDPSVETRREVDENGLKFNLQVGRKFNRWVVRAGLIQSKGGFGIDYRISDLGLINSVEVFDYREDIGANVRLISEFRMWNVFYARLTGEDLVTSADNQSLTVSAGLRFNDEDLAAMLGLLSGVGN